MKLRNLEIKDAPLMLEWMHDRNVTAGLSNKFESKTIDDCIAFIESQKNNRNDLHMAIIDDSDEYVGTVSLKNIKNGFSEFAISIRSKAMGKGFATYAIKEIMNLGRSSFNVKKVYWQVLKSNERAVRFYDKNGYKRVEYKKLTNFDGFAYKNTNNINDFYWYLEALS